MFFSLSVVPQKITRFSECTNDGLFFVRDFVLNAASKKPWPLTVEDGFEMGISLDQHLKTFLLCLFSFFLVKLAQTFHNNA
jgi:hypothetical protein